MHKHEVLAEFYKIGRLHNVQITTAADRVYVARWFNIKIQAQHIKIQGPNSPEVIRIPYEEIRKIVQCPPRVDKREHQHARSPERQEA